MTPPYDAVDITRPVNPYAGVTEHGTTDADYVEHTAPPILDTIDEMDALMEYLAENEDFGDLIRAMTAIHGDGQDNGAWDTGTGRAFETALGHLRLAVEATQ